MKLKSRLLLSGLLLAVLPFAANADMPGKHPYYLHALSDLRAARWMLSHRPGDPAVSAQEDVAIGEIKKASIDDGKNLEDHPPVQGINDRPGRLHKALELLHKVHGDVAREEDDPFTKGLRDRAIMHIDEAAHATEHAIGDVRTGR
jgi:hypothetical protein